MVQLIGVVVCEDTNEGYAAKAKTLGQNFQTLDYKLISEAEIKELAEILFDAADVPLQLRTDYYSKWNTYKQTLRAQATNKRYGEQNIK